MGAPVVYEPAERNFRTKLEGAGYQKAVEGMGGKVAAPKQAVCYSALFNTTAILSKKSWLPVRPL